MESILYNHYYKDMTITQGCRQLFRTGGGANKVKTKRLQLAQGGGEVQKQNFFFKIQEV